VQNDLFISRHFVYNKIVHVLALNKKGGTGNINGVPVNKGQFETVTDSKVSRREHFIQLVV